MNISTTLYLIKKLNTELTRDNKARRDILRDKVSPLIPSLLEQKREGVEVVISADIEEYTEQTGFKIIDFGSGIKMTAYIEEDKAILFKYEEPKRETLPLVFVKKEALVEFFSLNPKDTDYYTLAKKLNLLTDTNKITVKKGDDFFVAARSKKLDKDLAFENIAAVNSHPLWTDTIERIMKGIEQAKEEGDIQQQKVQFDEVEALLEKFTEKLEEEGELLDNPYIKKQKGRISFDPDSISPFIKELEELNMEVANKITIEGKGEGKLTIKGEFSFEEISTMDKKLRKLLERTYTQKMEYLAQKENEPKVPDTTQAALKR